MQSQYESQHKWGLRTDEHINCKPCILHLSSIGSCNLLFHCYSLQLHNEEHGSGGQHGAGAEGCSTEGQSTWVNSLVGRIFWDFLQEKYWTDQVAHKIQKKLSKIKVRVDRLRVFAFIFIFSRHHQCHIE